MSVVRILLISDLHAFGTERKDGAPSYIDATQPIKSPTRDGFEALKALIRKENIRADLVVCAGDLGDKADAAGINHAWKELHQVSSLANASSTLAVCGNHDLDSRLLGDIDDDPDPKGVLQQLEPAFPVSDEILADKFWSRNFVTLDLMEGQARALLLNSSAFHGGKEEEINYGRVANRTVERISKTLTKEGFRPLNILVCHHHPFPHSQLDGTTDYQAMRNGPALLDTISQLELGPWIILHGHRHHPRISWSPSDSSSSVVIGAAAFSRRLSGIPNQAHLIEVETESDTSLEYDLRGRVTSWTFSWGHGFVLEPHSPNGLPPTCGFGYRGSISALTRNILQFLSAATGYVEWIELETRFPQIRYLMPEAFKQCIERLGASGITISTDPQGTPVHLMVTRR